jgi:amino acid transporter
MTQIADNANGYGLRHQSLTPLETLAQSIGNVAPTATPVIVIPLVFGLAGNGTWLAYLFATVGIFFVARNVNQFARHTASPGSLYAYITTGLGPWLGLAAGWALLAAYTGTAAAVTGGFTNYANVLLRDLLGFEVPAVLLIAVAVFLSWLLAYRDIKLSARATLALELLAVGLILVILGATLLTVPTVIDTAQLSLEGVSADSLRLGLVLALFSFVGFESAASLGSEDKDPLRTIPRAILRSAIFIGLFFIVAAYTLVLAFHNQPPGVETLDKSNAPLHVLATYSGLGALRHLIDLGAVISFFACTLASINAGARILFLLGRHGVFHASVGNAHAVNRTPHVAVTVSALATFLPAAYLAVQGYGAFDIFGWIGSFASYGFIVAYVLVSIAAPVYLYRHHSLGAGAVISAVIAIVLLLIALAGNIYPVPPAPLNWLPYAFVAYLAAGLVWFGVLRLWSPKVTEEIYRDLAESQLGYQSGPAE